MHEYSPQGLEEGVESLELKLQAVVIHPVWVMGTKLRFFGRTAITVNH